MTTIASPPPVRRHHDELSAEQDATAPFDDMKVQEPPLLSKISRVVSRDRGDHSEDDSDHLHPPLDSSDYQRLFQAMHDYDDSTTLHSQSHSQHHHHGNGDGNNNDAVNDSGVVSEQDLLLFQSLQEDDDDDNTDSAFYHSQAPLLNITVQRRRLESPVSMSSCSAILPLHEEDDDNNAHSVMSHSMEQFLQDFECTLDETLWDLRRTLQQHDESEAMLEQTKRERAATVVQHMWRRRVKYTTTKTSADESASMMEAAAAFWTDSVLDESMLQQPALTESQDSTLRRFQSRVQEQARHQLPQNETAAAIRIQSLARGHIRRRQASLLLQELQREITSSSNAVVGSSSPNAADTLLHSADFTYSDSKEAAKLIQTILRRYNKSKQKGSSSTPSRLSPPLPVTPPRSSSFGDNNNSKTPPKTPSTSIVNDSPARRLLQTMLASTRVTSFWKSAVADRNHAKDAAAVVIQSVFRRYQAQLVWMKSLQRRNNAATRLASAWRLYKERCASLVHCNSNNSAQKCSAITIQSIIRSYHARGAYVRLQDLRMEMAAIRLESFWRSITSRRDYQRRRSAVLVVQRQWQGFTAKRGFLHYVAATLKVQALVRRQRRTSNMVLWRQSAIKIQGMLRRYFARSQFMQCIQAAVKIQRAFSTSLRSRLRTRELLSQATLFFKEIWLAKRTRVTNFWVLCCELTREPPQRRVSQSLVAANRLVDQAALFNASSTRIQAAWRKALAYFKYISVRRATVKCQALFRAFTARQRSEISIDSCTLPIIVPVPQTTCSASPFERHTMCIQRVWRRRVNVMNRSAAIIQAHVRSSLAKQALREEQYMMVIENARMASAVGTQRAWQRYRTKKSVSAVNSHLCSIKQKVSDMPPACLNSDVSASIRIQRWYRAQVTRELHQPKYDAASDSPAEIDYQLIEVESAALTVQSFARGFLVRQQFSVARDAEKVVACITLQRKLRSLLAMHKAKQLKLLRATSVRRIERAWIRHLSQVDRDVHPESSPRRRPRSIPEFVTIGDHDFDSMSGTLEAKEPLAGKPEAHAFSLLRFMFLFSTLGTTLLLASHGVLRDAIKQDISENVTETSEGRMSKPVSMLSPKSDVDPSVVNQASGDVMYHYDLSTPPKLSLSHQEVESIQAHVVESYRTHGFSSMCGANLLVDDVGYNVSDAITCTSCAAQESFKTDPGHFVEANVTQEPCCEDESSESYQEFRSDSSQAQDESDCEDLPQVVDSAASTTLLIDQPTADSTTLHIDDQPTAVSEHVSVDPTSEVSPTAEQDELTDDDDDADCNEPSGEFFGSTEETSFSSEPPETISYHAVDDGFDSTLELKYTSADLYEHSEEMIDSMDSPAVVTVYGEETAEDDAQNWSLLTPSESTEDETEYVTGLDVKDTTSQARRIPVSELWTLDLNELLLDEASVASNEIRVERFERLIDLWTVDLEHMYVDKSMPRDVHALPAEVSMESHEEAELDDFSDQIRRMVNDATDRTDRIRLALEQLV